MASSAIKHTLSPPNIPEVRSLGALLRLPIGRVSVVTDSVA